MKTIMVVDDENTIRRTLHTALTQEGYAVVLADCGADGVLKARRHQPDVVLLDVRLPDFDGLEVLRKLKEEAPHLAVIMMSGHASLHTAVEATRLGALDFFEKPLSLDRILVTLEKALEFTGLREAHCSLQHEIDAQFQMVGRAPAMLELFATIEKVAPSRGTVLITGENGTGKELVARAVHRASPRSDGPFVKVNCAAIPETLIESELFGHEKGSFTGATARRLGKFELAHRGSIFLDEIGDMKTDMQAKLLRVLQEGEFERVGGSQTIVTDVRVIAATNREIDAEINEGRFREDLYYRLNILPLHVPPLRSRPEDIPLLAGHFAALSARENGRPRRGFSQEALQLLQVYHWPGNVRELRNVVERLVILSDSEEFGAAAVRALLYPRGAASNEAAPPLTGTLNEIVEETERRTILGRIRTNQGNMAQTARNLGLERSHLYKKMRALGISKDDVADKQ
jgi:DNA-binding NtrC family response regulator